MCFFFFSSSFSLTFTFQLLNKPRWQVSSLPPRFLPSFFIAQRVQHSHCSLIFHRVLLTHAPAVSTSQFVRKKKFPRFYTRMHSGRFELTKLTYTRLENNLIRHRGDRRCSCSYLYCLHEYKLYRCVRTSIIPPSRPGTQPIVLLFLA